MRWINAILNIPVETKTDELGNKTTKTYEYETVRARLTNWTLEEKAALDPDYTRVNRKAIFPSQSNTKTAETVTIDDNDYLISERIDAGRWQILHIRSYKQ